MISIAWPYRSPYAGPMSPELVREGTRGRSAEVKDVVS